MADPTRPLAIAVPRLAQYQGHTGIARVFRSLRDEWDGRVRLIDAPFERRRLPLLRNFPSAVRPPVGAEVVLLPQLTGAQALRDTGGLPSVVIVHDIGVVDFPGDRSAMDWLTYQSVKRGVAGLRHATRIMTVSRFTRDRLLRRMPDLADRVRVVPNGVGEVFRRQSATAPEARRRLAPLLGRPAGGLLVLNVGSDAPRKNVPLMLDVFRRVEDRHPEARLIRVRGGADPRSGAGTLRRARGLGLHPGKDLLMLDDVPDDATLADLYAAADVYVSTSLYEGFGLPALEALAVGTPVVVTRCGALPEVVGDAGWVVAPAVESLAGAIEEALAGPRRGRRTGAGRARAAAYTWSRAAEACLAVLGEAGGRAGARQGAGG